MEEKAAKEEDISEKVIYLIMPIFYYIILNYKFG